MDILGVILFAVTYALISMRRRAWLPLSRASLALLGAAAFVLAGRLSPAAALHAIEPGTLLLLLGMMGVSAVLAVEGFFDTLESWLLSWARTPAQIAGALVWGSGLLGALVTNDAVCVLGTPLVVRLIQRHRLPAAPLLLALASGANTGSVATLIGNPQNMLCGTLGQLSFLDYSLRLGPVALVSLALNHALLALLFRQSLAARAAPLAHVAVQPLSPRARLALLVLGGIVVACAAGAPMALAAVAGFAVLLLAAGRSAGQIFRHIDGSLLLFFAGLFVVVEGLLQSGAPALLLDRFPLSGLGAPALSALFLVGSNIVSNVPFILVIAEPLAALPDPTTAWQLLAMASTFAGNLTLLGSAANIIVAEGSLPVGGLGFWQHLRLGAPLALLSTALGTLWLGLMSP